MALNDPAKSGLQWSIVTFIDLRMRTDGFINTPPVASVASPQYAIVNKTIQINIPVSDVNAGDDVRCRWSVYIPGYRRRRSDGEKHLNYQPDFLFYKRIGTVEEIIHTRKKRGCGCGGNDPDNCGQSSCLCSCSLCNGNSNCGTTIPTTTTYITAATTSTTSTTTKTTSTTSTTTKTTSTTSTTTTTVTTTVTDTTTIDTPGTLKSTSTYPYRQAIDECGGICYPSSTPNGTTLSSCTITFTGHKAGTWYAVAIQVK